MNILRYGLLTTLLLAASLAGAAPAADNYEPMGYKDVRCGITNFTYDGVMDGPHLVKPISGRVGLFICEDQKIELASPHFEDGFILTKDYGKIKVRFGMSLSGTTFTIWMTPEQKKALGKLRKQ